MTSAEIKERIRFLEEMLKLLQSIVAFKTPRRSRDFRNDPDTRRGLP